MKSYRLKLTALTPIHIGTGESYEPTNFIVDGEYLYEFEEQAFYRKLEEDQKKRFLEIATKRGAESLFELHRFVKMHAKSAKEASHLKVKVTKGIAKDYQNKVGRVVQEEGKGKNRRTVFNRFQIERTLRQPNTHYPYIPGSSIKGAFSTAYQEGIYQEDSRRWERDFGKPLDNIFKNLMVSDTTVKKIGAKIGYALNKERFEEETDGPDNKLEVILPGSEFEAELKIRDYQAPEPVDFNFLKLWCDRHYLELFESIFKPTTTFKGNKVDDYTNEYYPDDFYTRYKDFKPKEKQFLIRVGKHSGARAVTIEGMREIRVKVSGGGPRRKPNKWETLDQETTTWMFGESDRSTQHLLPFGWLLCEVVESRNKEGLTLEDLAKELSVTTERLVAFAKEENITLLDDVGYINTKAVNLIREYRQYL